MHFLNLLFRSLRAIDVMLFIVFSVGEVVIHVYNRLQVQTLEMFADQTSQTVKFNAQSWEKDISFVLLQLTNALKYLQAQGIEEVPATLDPFILVRDDKDLHFRVVILDKPELLKQPRPGQKMSLSKVALAAMLLMFQCENPIEAVLSPTKAELPELSPSVGMFKTMSDLLYRGSSTALGHVNSMLEYMLWGPSDISFEFALANEQHREQELQRWLDLERATVLNNLIRTQGWVCKIELAVFEEYHLLFLVQTCAKMLHEASLLFESEVACM